MTADKSSQPVCRECEHGLPYTNGAKFKKHGEFFEYCISPLYYRGIARRGLLRFKFHGAKSCAPVFAAMMRDALREDGACFDTVTWVPVSKERLRKRGYDQTELLAKALCDNDIPCVQLLRKTRNTPPQTLFNSPEKRRANISMAYEPVEKNTDFISGRHILLVDDIITTGSTLSECSRTLLMSGAESIICITAARTE